MLLKTLPSGVPQKGFSLHVDVKRFEKSFFFLCSTTNIYFFSGRTSIPMDRQSVYSSDSALSSTSNDSRGINLKPVLVLQLKTVAPGKRSCSDRGILNCALGNMM